MLKFIIDYRKITLVKTFDNTLDAKVKKFINYIIIVNLYNDILPLINLSKPCMVTYQKKQFANETDKQNNKFTMVEDKKNVGLVLNKLNPKVIENLWA